MPVASLLNQTPLLPSRTPHLRRRIDVRKPGELDRWAHKFGVTQDRLRQLIAKVGSAVSDVERELGSGT